ncbi:Holliday junction resolvase RuvX [Candidatus Poribacteria bacterium]|nr:Holliday junction resolvase RuvX [Candidatus Poribacteria bacterium]
MPILLGLDVGDKRIGVAKSDALGMLATPLTTIERSSDRAACREIVRIAAEHDAVRIVVGLPKMLDNSIGIQAEKVLVFVQQLKAATEVPVVLWDERLTTTEASRVLRKPSRTGRRQAPSKKERERVKARLDEVSAAIILESYLASPVPSLPPEDGE